MFLINKDTALILIDVQNGFDDEVWGQRNNPDAELQMAHLLTMWRETGRPIFHIQHLSRETHSPLRPNQSGSEIKEIVAPLPHEPVMSKCVNSAFIGTALEYRLVDAGASSIVLAGLTTDHCVSTSARMAANLGFDTYVVSDATATFERVGHDGKHHSAESIHELALVSLHKEFATIIDTKSLLEQSKPNEVFT